MQTVYLIKWSHWRDGGFVNVGIALDKQIATILIKEYNKQHPDHVVTCEELCILDANIPQGFVEESS